MEHGNPFGIEDEGKTAGLLSYFFILGWSMAFFAFHKFERTQLSSFHLRQTLMLYISYVFTRFGLPYIFGLAGLNVQLFSSLFFILPVNFLFVGLWTKGLLGAMNGEETAIPIFGEPAQRLFANFL